MQRHRFGVLGGRGRGRTFGLTIIGRVLYQLSYTSTGLRCGLCRPALKWLPTEGSNLAFQSQNLASYQ